MAGKMTIKKWWENIRKHYPKIEVKGLPFSVITNGGTNLIIIGEKIKGNSKRCSLIGTIRDSKNKNTRISVSGATTLLAAGKTKKEKIKIPNGYFGTWEA